MAIQSTILEPLAFNSMADRTEWFSRLPYKLSPYNSRNWGHSWHSLCSYPSKLKSSIAHFLVEYFSKPGDLILDPFSGVGTISFEACLAGREGVGIDLNPLAFHATNSKVSMPLRDEVMRDYASMQKFMDKELISSDEVPEEIRGYFHPDTLKEIVTAREFLIGKFESDPKPAISFLITNVAHLLHGNRPYALSRRSHNVIPIPPKGEFEYKSLNEHLEERIKRYLLTKKPHGFRVGRAYLDSVFDFKMDEDSIDGIMTSPPFFGNTEFLRQNRIRIWFCGWDYDKQKEEKEHFVDGMGLDVYSKIFRRFNYVMRAGGLCILHLGVVRQKDMALSILPYAEKNGFEKQGLIYEDTTKLESHGRTDRGGTHKHQFLILRKID